MEGVILRTNELGEVRYDFCFVCLKPLDTFGKQYCLSPTLHVSQLIYNNKPVKI